MIDPTMPPLPEKVVVDTHTPTGVKLYGYTDQQVLEYAARYADQRSQKWQAEAAAQRARADAMAAVAQKHYEEVERLRAPLALVPTNELDLAAEDSDGELYLTCCYGKVRRVGLGDFECQHEKDCWWVATRAIQESGGNQ